MYVIRWVLLISCIFGMYILVTGASVSLKTFDEGNAYLKDSAVTLVCNITPYNNEMTWYVDNDPYAGCFLGTCAPSANKPYTFTFTFDETAGLFNLTIDSVNSSHAELSFACDDGSVRETISFNVTTDNGTTSNTSKTPTKPDINNQITVANEGNGDNDDRTLGGGAIAGIVVGIVVIAVIIVVNLYRWKKVTEMENKICDVNKVLDTMQPEDKQTLYLDIVKEEKQIIQELENRKVEIIRSSWVRQGSSEERQDRNTTQLESIKAQDRNTTQLESIKAQVEARKTLFRLEGAEHAKNTIIHGYIDKVETRNRFFSLQDPVSYRIFSRVIMEDIEIIKKRKGNV